MLEEFAPRSGQPVSAFGDLALREGLIVAPFSQISATALDEILAQLLTERPMRIVRILAFRKRHEFRFQQRQQVTEPDRASRMESGRREDHVAVLVLGKLLDELPAALASAPELGAGVGLVHDHEFGSRLQEGRHMLVVLDVVKRNDRKRIIFEDREIGVGNLPLQLGRGRRRDRLGLDMEVPRQFGNPLIDERRRTKDASPLDFAAVQQFAKDESGLDGLADAHVIGDQQAHRPLLERHHQGDELIGPRGERQIAEGAKRPRPGPQRKPQGVPQQNRLLEGSRLLRIRRRERRRAHVLLQRHVQ